MFVFQEIKSINEVDYDNLFLESEKSFSLNFPNDSLVSLEEKKNFYSMQLMRTGDIDDPLKKLNETYLMFKVSLYDKDVMFKGGYIEVDGITHRGHWFLTANGPVIQSKSWLYTPEFDIAQREFYAQYGITQHKVLTMTNSPLYKMLKNRSHYVTSNSIVDRAFIVNEETYSNRIIGRDDLQFVIMTIKL